MLKKKTILLISITALSLLIAVRLFQVGTSSSITVEAVRVDTAIDAVPAVINVRSDYTFTLSSEEGGRVITSELNLGSKIQANELVLQINPTDLEIDIQILEADIENLKAQIALTGSAEIELKKQQEDLENYERLYAAGSYAELEIQRRRREFAVFKESQIGEDLEETKELNGLEGRLKILKLRLEKTQIYAPTGGIVTEIYAYPGELVSSSSALAQVFSDAVVVEAKINEEDFAGVTTGLDATVRFLTYGNQLFEASIDRVLPTADKENQQYTALLNVEIPDEKLLPGLSGEASIIRKKIPNALIIPRRALLGNFVFKVVGNTAQLTPVKIGVRGLNNAEIREGLKEGDLIVTDGMSGLKDGDAIRYAD